MPVVPPRTRVAVTMAVVLATTLPMAAHAEPVDPRDDRTTTQAEVDAAKRAVVDGQADVVAAQKDLDEARAQVEAGYEVAAVASEKANAARAELTARTAEAAKARTEARAAASAAAQSQQSVEQMATQLYMRGGPMADFAWLLGGTTGDLARAEADIDAAEGFRVDHLADARRTKTAADAARTKAEAARTAQQAAATAAATALAEAQRAVASAEKQAKALEAQESRLVARLADLRRTSIEVEQRRQEQLQREAAAREAERVRARAAAVARAAEARASQSRGASGDVAPPTNLPAPDSAAAATAIAWAQQQLGKPYLWGGNGPAAFDCSGLMVGSWRAAGKSLPRTAQWQYGATARVPIADLQPGDLVFFGRSTSSIYHVGMYVGNGQMIEAPRTGLNLRYSSIYRSSLLPYGGRV